MICKSIEEYTLRYLENESAAREKHRLERHLHRCGRCRMMFELIKANYHSEEKVSEKEIPLSEKIGVFIDKSRYQAGDVHRRQFSLKKVFIFSIALALLIITVANADTIFKTYKELKNAMFVDQKLMNISGIKNTGTYSDESYVKSVYEKYEEAVQAKIDQMETAENVVLTFDEDGKEFNVQIAKGIKGNFITFWFDGHTRFNNDFSEDFSKLLYDYTLDGPEKYDSIEELLDSEGFAPVPGYIPDGFNLMGARRLAAGRERTIPQSLMLLYRNSDDKSFSISLTKSKMVADNIGIPEELQNAANLFMQQTEQDTPGENTGPQQIMEEMIIDGYQAVYSEGLSYSSAMDGTYKIFKTVSIYLGDAAKLPILRIESSDLDKETILKVASQVEIHNNDKNLIDGNDYFKGIKDEKILAHTDKFLEKVKAGQSEFRLKIDDNTELYRHSQNDSYYIMYRNVPVDQSQSMIPLAVSLDENILKNIEYADVQILGRPYSSEKSYCLFLTRKKNTAVYISMDRPITLPDGIELTDYIISRMSSAQIELNPLFSHSGHLYYLDDDNSHAWILNTSFEENGTARNYTISIDKDILKDIGEVIDFINSL